MSLDSRVRDDLRVAGDQMVDPPLNLAGVMRRGRRRRTVRLVASGLAAAALVTGGAVLFQRADGQQPVVTDPTPTTGAHPTPTTGVTDPTSATTTPVAIPGDGWVAYEAGGDIFIVGQEVAARRLVDEDDGLNQICPVFSPDGTRLAYLEILEVLRRDGQISDITSDLIVVDIGESGEIVESLRLEVGALTLDCPKWSPDGEQLAYSRVMDNARAFERPKGYPDPIGGLWAVTASAEALEVHLAQASLGNSEWPGQGFEWSPRGDAIALLSNESVWLVPLDPQADPYQLTSGFDCGRDCVSVSWSPDGSSLAVAGRIADRSCLLKVVQVDGSGETELPMQECGSDQIEPVLHPMRITWSPDGRWIAYSMPWPHRPLRPDGNTVVYLVSPDTGEERQFTDPNRYSASNAVWSSDGSQVLYWAGGDTAAGFELLSQGISGDLAPVVLASDPNPDQPDFYGPTRQISSQPTSP